MIFKINSKIELKRPMDIGKLKGHQTGASCRIGLAWVFRTPIYNELGSARAYGQWHHSCGCGAVTESKIRHPAAHPIF